MKPHLPSPDTPQRRSTTRFKYRKSIESYLKFKYPDSTFHHLKFTKSSDEENGVESKPVARESENVKANVGKHCSPLVKHSRCSYPVENEQGESKNSERPHPTKVRQSDVGVGFKKRRGRPKKNHPEPQNVWYSSSSVNAISKSVQGEGRTNGKLSSPVIKLSRYSSLIKTGGEPSKNPEPTHSTKVRQSGVSLKNNHGRLKNDDPEPQNVVDSISPVPAISKSLLAKGCTGGKPTSSVVKRRHCSSPIKNRQGDSKSPGSLHPTMVRQSDGCVGLRNNRRRGKKGNSEPQNVSDSSSPVTAISESLQAKGRTGGRQNCPVMKLSRYRSPVEINPKEVRQLDVGVGLKSPQGRRKKNKPEPQNVFDSSSPVTAMSKNVQAKVLTDRKPRSPPTKGRQSDIGICLKNKQGRLKKDNLEPQNIIDSSYPNIVNIRTHSSTFKTHVNDICLTVGKPQNVTSNGRLVVDTLNTTASSSDIMYMGSHRTNSENFMYKNIPVVKLKRLEDELNDCLKQYGFVSASRLEMKSSAASENFKYSLSKNTKNGTLDRVCENSENRNETNSTKFLGFGSPKKAPAFIKYLTKPNCVLDNSNGSRSRRNRRSINKDWCCKSTEDILTNGAKRLAVRLHDSHLEEQCLKSQTIEDRPSKLKKIPVRQLPRKYSESLSSIQPKNISAKPRILHRSNHSAKKSKSQLTVAKNIGKVDDVVQDHSSVEQNSNAIPMVMQPIVVQQIFMQQIVMQPIVVHNYTYQLPGQGLQLVSGHAVPAFPDHGRGGVGSMNQCDDTISIISSAESLDSGDSENEIMVQSLINKDPDYSELHDICYISEETERQALPNLELEEFCYISEETKLHAPSNGGDSTRQLDNSSEEQRLSLPDAAIVNTSCGDELPSDYNIDSSNQLESFTKKETSSLDRVLSPMLPNEVGLSGEEQNQPRTLDCVVEESSDSCKMLPIIHVSTNQKDSCTPNEIQPNSSTELVENMGTVDMELPSLMPSNEDNGTSEQPRLLNTPGQMSLDEQKQHSCSELPSDRNDLSIQKGVINPKENPSGLPTNPVEMETLGERSSVSDMASNKGINEGQSRRSTNEVTVCKSSLVGGSCEIGSDISDAVIKEERSSPNENLTVLEGTKKVQTLQSTPEVSDQKPPLVEESRESCSDQNDVTNHEDGFNPIQNPSVAPAAPIEDVDDLEGTCRSSLCKMSSNKRAEKIQIQSSKLELLVEKSTYSDEGKESCCELALNDPTSHNKAFNIDKNQLAPPQCEISSTGEKVEDEIQSRSPKLSVNKLKFDDESREFTCESSSDNNERTRDENRPATPADSIEDMETLVGSQKERLPTSCVSRLSDRQGLLDDENCKASSKLSPDHNDMSNQKLVFTSNKNQPISPVQSVENMEAVVETKKDQPFASELPAEELSLDEEGRESFSESPLIHDDVTIFSAVESVENMEAYKGAKMDKLQPCAPESSVEEPLIDEESTESCSRSSLIHDDDTDEENGFTPAVNQSVSPVDSPKNMNAFSPVEYIDNMEGLEGATNFQLQSCAPELSIERTSLCEESTESCNRSLSIQNDLNSEENGFNPVLNQPVSPAENLNTFEETCRSFSDEISLSERAKELQSQPSSPGVFSESNQESFSNSPSDHNSSANEEEEGDGENWPDSPLNSVENVEERGEIGGCSVREMSPWKSLNDSLNHGTMEEEILPSSHEVFVGKYPLDEKSRDYGNKSSPNPSEPSSQDEGFVQVEPQTVSPSESVENVDAVGGVVCQIILNEDNTTKNEYWHALERIRSSTPNISNVTRLLDKVKRDISFTKPSLPSYLDETIQEERVFPEKTSQTTPTESTEKQQFSKTGLFNQTTTNCYELPPEQSKRSSSLDEMCRVSFRQALAGDESTLEKHFTPENDFPPSSCESTETPPLKTRDKDSECPSSCDLASQWENVNDKTHHCSVYVENGSSEGNNADSEQMPLDSKLPKSDLTPEFVHENPSSGTQGDNDHLIKGCHSSNSMETELGDILEKSVEIDKHLNCFNKAEFRDEKKESVRTNTSFSENTLFHVEPLVGSNVDYEGLDKTCSQETRPADFLEMSDYTEALVDACLRENLPESSDDCLPSILVVESADFPSVSGTNEFLGESARDSGQLAEAGMIANLPVEFGNECVDLDHLPTISNSVDLGDQNVSSPSSTASHPPELIFDGFFYETDEPINLPLEGDLNTELCQYGSKSEEMQSTLVHKSQLNDDKFLNITDQNTEVHTDFPSQRLLNSTQPEDVHLSFELTQPSSSSEIDIEHSGEGSRWQSTRGVSLTVVPKIAGAQNQLEKCAVPEKKQPINVRSEISSKVNELLFDEEFEQSNNVIPMKRTRVGERMSPGPSAPVASNPSELLFDEEFESSNNSTPVKKIKVGPSVTVSRVRSRTSSELLFDEEFERSNNASPAKKQMGGKRPLRAASPQEVRVTSLGLVNELLIDENDEPPLNPILESVNDINERSVSRNTYVGCVVISSDEESENPPIHNYPGISHTNSARPLNRPAIRLPNKAKTLLQLSTANFPQISGKSKREPIATSSPRIVGKSKGRNPPQKRMAVLSPVSEKVCHIDLSDTESEIEYSPPRKISKVSVSDEETSDHQKLKELASSRNQLKGKDEGIHCNQGSSERPSEMYWTHCAPIEPDEDSPFDLDDSEIDAESRNPLPCPPWAPEKSNAAAPIRSIEATRNSRDVIELTDSDTENAPNRVTVNPYDSMQYSGRELSTDYLDEFIESDDSFKAEKNDQVRPPSSPKPLTTKPLLSIQRQDFIKNYSEQLVELAETIYRKKKNSALKLSPSKSQPTQYSALVPSDSEHSSDSMSVGDFIESDDGHCSGEEDPTTSPRYSLLRQSLISTNKSTTTTLQNSKVSAVYAEKSKIVGPSSYRCFLNTSIDDIISSDNYGSMNRSTLPKSLSKPPFPRRSQSILTKPTVIHQKNTTSKPAAPSNMLKGSTLSSICRGIPLDDRGNYGSGSNINKNLSHMPSPEALPSKPVFSTHLQTLSKKALTDNLTRSANSAKKSKLLLKEKLASSTSQGKDNNIFVFPGRSILSESPSSIPGSSGQSQNLLKKRVPMTLKAKTPPKNTALRSRLVPELVPATPAREINLSHQSDDDQRPLSGLGSGRLTTPDCLSSKLVLSRQSLNFIKSVTQNRSKGPNTAPKKSKPPATPKAKKLPSLRGNGRRVS